MFLCLGSKSVQFLFNKRGHEDTYFIMPVNVTIQNNSGKVFSLILKKYIIRLNEVNKKNVKKKEDISLKSALKKNEEISKKLSLNIKTEYKLEEEH